MTQPKTWKIKRDQRGRRRSLELQGDMVKMMGRFSDLNLDRSKAQ